MARKPTFKAPAEVHYRECEFNRAALNEESRTVELCFSSETPVERGFGLEILDHTNPGSCDLSRLNSGGPLLMGHNPDDQIGVVESARIDAGDKKGRAVVRFSKSARAQEIFQDVKDGIRTAVSVGYRIGDLIRKEKVDGVEAYRLAFTPLEVSLVSIPADNAAGVGRAEQLSTTQPTEITMSTPTDTAPDLAALRAEVLKGEQKRTSELLAIGAKFGADTEARTFIGEGKSVEDFRAWVLENKFNAKPATQSAELGMSEKEKRNFSVVKAIRQLSSGKPLDGIEREASDAAQKLYKREGGINTFTIPHDMVTHKRADYTAGSNSAGGYTVQTDVLGASLIELLRNKMVTAKLGARNLSGLIGNVAIPRQATGATAYWLAETAAITESEGTFEQLALTPHRLGAYSEISKTLLQQSTVDMEGFIRNDLMTVLAIAKDTAALQGSGASGQPTGIVNTSGVGSVTFGGAATWPAVVSFETAVGSANADAATSAYVTTAAVRGAWKGIQKATNYPSYLWDSGSQPGEGMVNGYRAAVTNSVSSNKVIFGDFSQLVLADWGGIDISVNPYSGDINGLVRIVVQLWTDVGVRHAESFAVSSDAGNQ
jgi:HK97 family phage major capsid protein/HK97 family phage prohead protease